ncbi:DUF3231 family protein [Bacillus sp. HMF5848]|uniref:DUF3231 family protein n=1 Tax=Bacillus sp. HMF5848 TaxID=2495421 RepID=UPI000F7B6516|nr:DUF3231 family protein [Bacillus sp. HMF5848]RSK26310.1 DUF3231 family protein [Bacillus sp. HMF5848]
MDTQNIRLTSTEIGGLWTTYIQDSATICFLQYFKHHTKDKEILSIVKDTLSVSQRHIDRINQIFEKEQFPVPNAFSEKDYSLSTPPLFYDLFALSFIYGLSRISMPTYGNITSTVARLDIVNFFSECIVDSKNLYQKALNLMLSKGIYDRPPKISYPKEVAFVSDKAYVGHIIGSKRPLNVLELTELFFQIEQNYFGSILLTAFLQTVKDEKIKKYFKKGKKLTEKIISLSNEILLDDGFHGNIPVSMEITDSTDAPFSDKLMLYIINSLNSSGINYLGHAISRSSRKDLSSRYIRLLPDLLTYSEDGLDLLIERSWLEQPPQSIDRNKLIDQEK